MLTEEQKNEIGNRGKTLDLGSLHSSNTSLKSYNNDHKDNFDEMNKTTGMCLSQKSMVSGMEPYNGGANCIDYSSCMFNAPAFIELSWPKDNPVFPGRKKIELQNLSQPKVIKIPNKIFSERQMCI